MKLIAAELEASGQTKRVAYYHAHWTREGSPLLDELGAAIDHVKAFSAGGECSEENLRTSCSKCNIRKSDACLDDWEKRPKRKAVKGKYGDPKDWDGLASVFVALAQRNLQRLSAGEREWLMALKVD